MIVRLHVHGFELDAFELGNPLPDFLQDLGVGELPLGRRHEADEKLGFVGPGRTAPESLVLAALSSAEEPIWAEVMWTSGWPRMTSSIMPTTRFVSSSDVPTGSVDVHDQHAPIHRRHELRPEDGDQGQGDGEQAERPEEDGFTVAESPFQGPAVGLPGPVEIAADRLFQRPGFVASPSA